ncbi:hypothetical protein [Sporosarcina newyorkensis]|uniref:Uncharacterized protein n=1 Tax=Sporosarcina newyorkensis TaxID=759851 RepID=A0A1T4XHT3_9BACL|nr:hypothetical protein [Sporosarcina newyorkensis]SKA88681.1 hypothetical protein SAMN04244570_0724 [Sporosarcina newyorkensis]
MRRIIVVTEDYSDGPILGWTRHDEGFLINPRLVLDADEMDLDFLLFDEPIADDQQSVNARDALHFQVDIFQGNSVEDIDIEKLANMTIAQLGEFLTGTSK